MSNIDFFSQDLSSTGKLVPQAPFFTVKDVSKDELLKWLQQETANRERYHEAFFGQCQNHLKAYSNGYFNTGRQTDSKSDLSTPFRRTTKYVVNHLFEMTERLVSKMTRIKPAVEVLPANDEFEDGNSAKAVKLLIKHLWYVNDVDFLLQKVHRHKYIFGESYLCVDWNKDIGDLHPDYITVRNAAQQKNKEVDKNLLKELKVYVGDVEYKQLLPWNVLLEMKREYCDVQNVIIKEIMPIAEVQALYPDMAKQIAFKHGVKEFNMKSMKKEALQSEIILYKFYQKDTRQVLGGKKIVFIHDLILEETDLPFSHGQMPLLRLTDLDIPGQLHGASRYTQALPIQNANNNLNQNTMKNEFLMSAPKWVMPRGACKVEQLGNGRTVIQYQGPVAPQLIQSNPTNQTTLLLTDRTREELGTIMSAHPVSSGQPPQGIESGVALQFLNEQETVRSASDIAKHNNFVKDVAIRTISVAGDNYQMNDGRMLRIVGKENKHLMKFFDAANLHKDYDVRIQNSSALPESKAARMERILMTMQYGASIFTPERWAELLEFGSTEKMHTLMSEAIHSAESTVQDILEGIPVADPESFEDLITHLRVFYKALQKRSFKEEVPLDRREYLKLYTKTLERLASEKAAINPLFAAKLAQLELFPIFWQAPVPPSRQQQELMVQGQANRGEAITGQIPAEEPDQIPGDEINRGGK